MAGDAKEQFLNIVTIADALEKQSVAINGRRFIREVATQDGRRVEFEGLTLPLFDKGGEIRRATYNAVVGGIALADEPGMHYPKADGVEFNALNDRPAWMYLRQEIAAAE